MTTPITREQLQGMRDLRRLEKLTELVNEETREGVLERARDGGVSYFWEVDEPRLRRTLDQQGWANTRFTMEELQRAVQALYVGCDVTIATELVYIPQREAQPKREPRVGIQIDWS